MTDDGSTEAAGGNVVSGRWDRPDAETPARDKCNVGNRRAAGVTNRCSPQDGGRSTASRLRPEFRGPMVLGELT